MSEHTHTLPDGTEIAHVSLDAMPEYVDFDGLAKHIYNVYGWRASKGGSRTAGTAPRCSYSWPPCARP